MILVVAMRDARGLPAADLSAGGLGIRAGEGDGGRIVVELVEMKAEGLDGADHDGRHQGGPIRVEKPVEGATHPVVVQTADLVRFQPEQGGEEGLGPLLEAVDRPAPEEDVAQQDAQGGGWAHPAPPVHMGDVLLKEPVQAQAIQNMLEHRQGTEGLGAEGEVGEVVHGHAHWGVDMLHSNSIITASQGKALENHE